MNEIKANTLCPQQIEDTKIGKDWVRNQQWRVKIRVWVYTFLDQRVYLVIKEEKESVNSN